MMLRRWLPALVLVAAALAVASDQAHAQTPTPTRDTSLEFNGPANDDYYGIALDGTYAYLAWRGTTSYIRVYRRSDQTRQPSREIPLTGVNDNPQGVAVDDTYAYVVDGADRRVYVYRLSTGLRQTDREFFLDANNTNEVGMAVDDTYAYVLDHFDDHVYVYQLSDGTRVTDREWDLAALNTLGVGMSVTNGKAYVLDFGGHVYIYQLSDGDRLTDEEFDLSTTSYRGVAVRGGFVYALVYTGQVHVYRIGSAPEAPTLQLEPGDQQIRVTWTPPDDNGSEITSYDVQYRAGTSGPWLDAPHTGVSPAATVSGLENGTLYQVRVRAVNEVGASDWSTVVSATPRTVPDAPSAPTLTPGENRQIAVSWQAPDDGGSAITGYDVQYRSSLDWTVQTYGVTLSATLTSLELGHTYEIQVRAKNAAGPGPWSFSAYAAPITPGSVRSVNLPLVALWRTPLSLEVAYNSDPAETDTLAVSGDATLSVSPDCDVTTATYSPPPASLPIYPCAVGNGSISLTYGGDSTTWTRTAQVLQPRLEYSVTVTSEANTALSQPVVTWRSLSWPLYRDRLIREGTVLVVEEGEGLNPLYYEEPGRDVTAVDLVVCPNGVTCSTGQAALWSSPPSVGDVVYFAGDVPPALLRIVMATEGSRSTPWALNWDYGTATGWEPLPDVQDGTANLSKTGAVTWNDFLDDSRPMAPRVVAPLTEGKYVVRATLASAGGGVYTEPLVATAGAQAGLWSTRLRTTLEPGAATALRVYILDVALAYRRPGPADSVVISPIALETSLTPWRPWSPPVGTSRPPDSGEVGLPDNIAQPIDSDGGLPLIGFAVEKASSDAGVPTLLLYTLIGTAVAFLVLVVTQRATQNIMLSVIASGLVLVALAVPSVGLGSIWVVLVYAFTAGATVVIGNRLQT